MTRHLDPVEGQLSSPGMHENAPQSDDRPTDTSIVSPRIVFIRSVGHSGSTLLDMLISSHPEVVSVGEVVRFNTYPDSMCACFHRASECPFWLAVEEVLRARFDLKLETLNLRSDSGEHFERHNLALFDAVREVSGKKVIVDSSKRMDRLVPLMKSEQLDVVPVHLIRNLHGVVYSHMKSGRDWSSQAISSALGVIRTKEFLRHRPHIEVRYRDLAQNPQATLARVMGGIGLEYDPDQLNWAGRPRHNVGGNRKVRHSSDSTIKTDTSWREGLTLRQRFGISLVALAATVRGYLGHLKNARS